MAKQGPRGSTDQGTFTNWGVLLARDRRILIRLWLGYGVLLLALPVILPSAFFVNSLTPLLGAVIAKSGALVLNLFGQEAAGHGDTLIAAGSALRIATGCNGIEVFVVVLPAFLLVPSSLRSKAIGIALTIGGVYVVNVIRVVSLCQLLRYQPSLFEIGHYYVWQALIIIGGLTFWLYWAQRFVLIRR